MYFSIFLGESGYRAGYVLSGAALAGALVLLLAAMAVYLIPTRYRTLLSRITASLLLVTGSIWFYLRLRG
jgi:hypothetical protein